MAFTSPPMKVVFLVFCSIALWAQSNTDVDLGKAAYRSNCAFCHGLTGRGGRGPSLVASALTLNGRDEEMKSIIRNGVPGTNMPAFEDMDADDAQRVVLFIRHLAQAEVPAQPPSGDASKGKLIYERSGCAGCHRIGMQGSVFGPDLTRVGAGRSLEYLRESLVKPTADIPDEYQGVTVVTRDGKRITGVRINEDTFTVQLRDASQKFQMFQKSGVGQVIHETKSLMPAYDSMSNQDLDNLVAYLSSLRGDVHPRGDAKKAEGIR
jgi:cytochrome c oxidase cbb3-type subunit 3